MKIDVIPSFRSNPLADDYIRGEARVARRYEGSPNDETSWQNRLSYLLNRPLGASRDQLADVLLEYNRGIGNDLAALRQIESLRDPDSLVVIGGQQSGLFTGPLLVIYKAITIIRRARAAAERYGRPVVPVFWIAGEDHDLAEVDHVHLLRDDHDTFKLQLPKQDHDRVSISHLKLDSDAWEQAIRSLAQEMPDTAYKPAMIGKLAQLCRESATLSDAFARIMAWLFGEFGLVLVDSALPSLRRLEAPMWEQLITHNDQLRAAYVQGKRDLEAIGYASQADVHPEGANLFFYNEGKRTLLYRKDDRYTDRQNVLQLSSLELMRIAREEPERLSNNVLTRPLMQDYVFPVLAVVLGPGEIAYWGQLREAFHCLGMKLPVIVPREGYTLLEPIDQKTLQRYELTIEEALYDLASKRERWLKSQDAFDSDAEFAAAENGIRAIYARLIEQAGETSAVMRELGRVNLSRIIEQVHYYRNRVQAETEVKHEVGLRQFDRLAASLRPTGIPQERLYNVFAYMNKFGDSWLRHLLEQHQPEHVDGRHHYIVHL